MSLKPCVFFDRDGIVNRSPGAGYVERIEDFHILPEFIDALELVSRQGYEAVIATNQRGVSLGRMTRETLDNIHSFLEDVLAGENLRLLDIMVCTADDDGDQRRKPNPGMLLEAAGKHGLDLSKSWMIGDNESDVIAGQRAGCTTIIVDNSCLQTSADHRVKDMSELVDFLKISL